MIQNTAAIAALAASFEKLTLPLAELKPHPANPRKHPDPGSREWSVLEGSLKDDYT